MAPKAFYQSLSVDAQAGIELLLSQLPEEREGSERRTHSLTREDIRIMSALIQLQQSPHTCSFNQEEVQFVHDLMSMYKDTRSTILKALLGFVFLIISAVAYLSYSAKIWGGGK